jgi:hypothetical protein
MSKSQKKTQQKVKVLYQCLNGVWYAFAENGADLYFGRVPVNAAASGERKANVRSPKAQKKQKAA